MFALVDSALLFIRYVPVSIGAGLFGLLLDADRKAVPVSLGRQPYATWNAAITHAELFRLTRRARRG